MLKKLSLAGGILFFTIMVSGCSASPEEEIQSILEAAVQKEKGFEEQQTPITESEKKEKQLYGQIIGLSMKEFDRIVRLSDDALKNIENREELIEKERKSILSAKEEFNKMKDKIKDIEDKKIRQQAIKVKETMDNRYAAHDELYKSYKESLSLDKQLYELFKKEDLKMDTLQEQINKINATYQKVLVANKKFNEETERYNKEKEALYKSADIKVANSEEDK